MGPTKSNHWNCTVYSGKDGWVIENMKLCYDGAELAIYWKLSYDDAEIATYWGGGVVWTLILIINKYLLFDIQRFIFPKITWYILDQMTNHFEKTEG